MARIDIPGGPGLERERMFALQPDIGMGMGAFAQAVYEQTSLPAREREVARVRVAALNGCPVCLNTRSERAFDGGFDDELFGRVAACEIGEIAAIPALTEREQLAGEFADRFATDHHRIDDDFFAELRAAFDDTEIVELAALCAMTVGNGRFMTVLGIAADDDGHYWLPEGEGEVET